MTLEEDDTRWIPPSLADRGTEGQGQNAATETEKSPGREISRVTSLNGSNDALRSGEGRRPLPREVLVVTWRIQLMKRGTNMSR